MALDSQSSGPRHLYVVSLRCHELSPWTSPSAARLDRKPDDSTDNTAPMPSWRPSHPRKTTTSIATRLAPQVSVAMVPRSAGMQGGSVGYTADAEDTWMRAEPVTMSIRRMSLA